MLRKLLVTAVCDSRMRCVEGSLQQCHMHSRAFFAILGWTEMQVTVVLYFRQAPPMDYQNESLLVASCHRLVRQDTVVESCRDLPFASSTFHDDSLIANV